MRKTKTKTIDAWKDAEAVSFEGCLKRVHEELMPVSENGVRQGFIGTAKFAKWLGLHRNTVLHWIRGGKLRATQVGSVFLVTDTEIARVMAEGYARTKAEVDAYRKREGL